jgi:LemA protein
MNSEDSISRMEAAGALTAEQAEELRRAARAAPHRSLPLGLIMSGAAVLAFALLAILGGNGGETPNTIQDVHQTINTVGGIGAMNRSVSNAISYLLFGLPVVLGLLYFVWTYNGLVKGEEAVYSAWADVESTYKRRADLVPNLVNVVETYMQHERATLIEVTDQRNDMAEALKALVEQQKAAGQALSTARPESEQGLAALDASQSALLHSLRSVLATVEAYPNLRSADQFLALQAELEGTENRINVARLRFNEAVQQFNSDIRVLPGSLVASLGHFQRKAYFTATAGEKQTVQVKIGK